MKFLIILISCFSLGPAQGQTLQWHYDLRHSIDPAYNTRNFPSIYFEYFKSQDSGKSLIKPGSFLLKMQADLLGEHNNMGKFYMQVSQSLRLWTPKIFLNLQYSGGLGITEPRQYSYYIVNTFSAGVSYPFRWGDAFLAAVLNYKWVSYAYPSQDFLFTLYWWKSFFHYKIECPGDFSIWTENKNHGDEATMNLYGKRFSFFAEPQCWYNLTRSLSCGTKINLYYHVLTGGDIFQVYPSLGIRYKL